MDFESASTRGSEHCQESVEINTFSQGGNNNNENLKESSETSTPLERDSANSTKSADAQTSHQRSPGGKKAC